jgi:hypothetical protein
MSDQANPEPQAMSAVLRLAPTASISREQLEEATMRVEEALAGHANDLTDGASASANFVDCSIEIDLLLDGASVGELHEKLAQVIMRLEQHLDFSITPRPSTAEIVGPALAVTSTASQVVEAPRDLVSA